MKLEIDVPEGAIREFTQHCEQQDHPQVKTYNPITYAIYEAYEKEKNKIQVGDWYIENSGAIYMYCLGDDPPLSRCKRLSQPLQDMLEKEIKETTRNS